MGFKCPSQSTRCGCEAQPEARSTSAIAQIVSIKAFMDYALFRTWLSRQGADTALITPRRKA
jgi:hypothetical protein